jgi:1-acyl-sn-glycerol-3-phosphate acyltransferase
MEPVYSPIVGFALSLMKIMKWKVGGSGHARVPRTGPAVLATNHVGYLDFVFVGAAASDQKRLVRFMAKKEVFDHRISGPLMRGMKHVPVDRFGRPRDSIDAAVAAMKSGEIIGMFPEATISRSFIPREGKSGAARMAMEAGAPLVPGAVWGSQRILTKDRPKNYERNIPITVDFGEPIAYDPAEDPAEVTTRLMASITELVDYAQRAYAVKPRNDGDRWWLPAHLGGTAPTVEEADAMAERDRIARAERRKKELDERG